MRGFGLRGLTVALFVCALLGADIARAGENTDQVRVPIGRDAHDSQPRQVTVAEGDHLWKISKRHLEDQMQRLPASSEIGPYWRQVIGENLATLRSGDPDLIYPGEVIELPATAVSEQP